MDELQRVKDFRTSEPEPSDTARDSARMALDDAISSAKAGSRIRMLRRRPRVRSMAFAAAAVAVAAAILVGVFGRGASPPGTSQTEPRQQVLVSSTVAVKALRHLAGSIVGHSLTVHPGQYLYSDFEDEYPTYTGSCVTYQVDHHQWWFGADGSGLMRDTVGPQQFTSPADRARCLNDVPNMQLQSGHTSDGWNAPNCLFYKPLPSLRWSDLSSDPRVLLQQMRKLTGGRDTPGTDFIDVGMFLRFTNTPHRVRSALYRAAALIPGIKLLGTVQDHDGRSGLGVSFPSQSPFVSGPHAPPPGQTSEMIFDQHTGALLGEQGTRPRFWRVYQPEKVVDELPSSPPPLGPPCSPLGLGHVHQVPGGTVSNGAPVTSP